MGMLLRRRNQKKAPIQQPKGSFGYEEKKQEASEGQSSEESKEQEAKEGESQEGGEGQVKLKKKARRYA